MKSVLSKREVFSEFLKRGGSYRSNCEYNVYVKEDLLIAGKESDFEKYNILTKSPSLIIAKINREEKFVIIRKYRSHMCKDNWHKAHNEFLSFMRTNKDYKVFCTYNNIEDVTEEQKLKNHIEVLITDYYQSLWLLVRALKSNIRTLSTDPDLYINSKREFHSFCDYYNINLNTELWFNFIEVFVPIRLYSWDNNFESITVNVKNKPHKTLGDIYNHDIFNTEQLTTLRQKYIYGEFVYGRIAISYKDLCSQWERNITPDEFKLFCLRYKASAEPIQETVPYSTALQIISRRLQDADNRVYQNHLAKSRENYFVAWYKKLEQITNYFRGISNDYPRIEYLKFECTNNKFKYGHWKYVTVSPSLCQPDIVILKREGSLIKTSMNLIIPSLDLYYIRVVLNKLINFDKSTKLEETVINYDDIPECQKELLPKTLFLQNITAIGVGYKVVNNVLVDGNLDAFIKTDKYTLWLNQINDYYEYYKQSTTN